MKKHLKQIFSLTVFRYAMVGGTVALADVIFFYIFASVLSLNYLWVNAIGFVLGTLINYLLSIRLVFTSGVKFKPTAEVMIIFVISATALLLNQVILYNLTEHFKMDLMVSKLLTVASVFAFNYLSRKYFVFKQNKYAN
jgi:putative flippase GtrA